MEDLEKLAKLIRYWILQMTTEAGSGHVTSSLSAVELMVGLMYGGAFKFEIRNPKSESNDRLIFSKGHASPLFYALWFAAENTPLLGKAGGLASVEGNIPKELMSLRKFGSRLEGHPTMRFPFTEAATGSLGQGLSVGVGMAMNGKMENLSYRTYVLLGDSEMAEGSNWEAMQLAAHYKLDNLVGILDVNRLGQRGETMDGHDLYAHQKRIEAFGWRTIVCDGHEMKQVVEAFKEAEESRNHKSTRSQEQSAKPTMIIAKTLKGKGVSFLEDKEGWHGKALKPEELEMALGELGDVDREIRGKIAEPIQNSNIEILNSKQYQISNIKYQKNKANIKDNSKLETGNWELGDMVATRKAYGEELMKLGKENPEVVVLDGEVSNSTYSELFKKEFPERFLEMFIAEQNMVGAAVGLARRGKIPWVSTFAAFWSRAFDQIRMAAYSEANVKFCGSHAGVSIGEDGASQMGLEDIALFRSIKDSAVLYPSDAVSTEKLVEEAAKHEGIVYLRTTRSQTPVIYSAKQNFKVGGSQVLRESKEDVATVVGAGITVSEALKAYEELVKDGIKIRVIDLYSVKPLDGETLRKAAKETGVIITVEDHYPEGGIGEAVAGALLNYKLQMTNDKLKVVSLAVRKMPMSGKPEELLRYEEIDAEAIVRHVKEVLK